nr:restriction endonuclease PLD domain-containing protein [Otariodibacter oris]
MQRLKELPLRVTVIGGMYSKGINPNLWESLNHISSQNKNIDLYFSTLDIHSKIYLWKKKNEIISVLIGSANFSRNGLCTNFRESLADASSDTFEPLNEYLTLIKQNSTTTPKISDNSQSTEYTYAVNDKNQQYNLKFKYDIPLYDEQKNIVPPKSGLNWGLSNGHVSKGDAYIRIPQKLLQENQNLIPSFEDSYISESSRRRNSDPIEIIWDDGVIMEASLEGNQDFNGLKYPKQIASYSSQTPIYHNGKRISAKSILGRYLRKRLNVSLEEEITIETLRTYGRNTITLSLVENGIYFADFSV